MESESPLFHTHCVSLLFECDKYLCSYSLRNAFVISHLTLASMSCVRFDLLITKYSTFLNSESVNTNVQDEDDEHSCASMPLCTPYAWTSKIVDQACNCSALSKIILMYSFRAIAAMFFHIDNYDNYWNPVPST